MRLMIATALLPLAVLAACQSKAEKEGTLHAGASGTGASRSYAASGFSAVELRGSDDVEVKTGNDFSVIAEGDPKALDQLQIEVINGTLRIGRKPGRSDDKGARIHVVLPKLTAASVRGSGDMTIARAEGNFRGSVAGSGDLTIAALDAADADLAIAGSGDLIVAGKAQKIGVSIAGSGNLEGEKLSAASADVSIAGSGNARAHVTGPASVSIVGSGDVELTGGAQCSTSAVGSGEARCS